MHSFHCFFYLLPQSHFCVDRCLVWVKHNHETPDAEFRSATLTSRNCLPQKDVKYSEYSLMDNTAVLQSQGLKLTVASSKFATSKYHLPPVKNVGSKKLLPVNSVLKVISWKYKPIVTEIIHDSSFDRTKHKSMWSKALLMPLTVWNFVWS